MNSAEVLIKFKGDSTDADKSMKNVSSGLSGLTKSFTIGSLVAKGITKAIEVFNTGLDDSINRIDTMNNFTTVMSNLGVATEDSSEVIQGLSEELVGLPTTLNSAASSVQRLTSYNGDIKKSEQYFLAMNNAIIAGTNDAGMQASAMEQLTQAYTKGKPDMQDWKTLLQAMPAQLKQVANAMGYVQTDQLYEALKTGEVSMNDFMDTLVELNETGINGMANLEEQARSNTAGIGTSITNMKTAFVRGVAGVVQSIDSALEPIGGLSGVISTLGKIGEQAFKGLGDILSEILPVLIEVGQEIMPVLVDIFKAIIPVIKDLAKALLPAITKVIKKLAPIIAKMAEKIMPLISKVIEAIIPLLDPIADYLVAYIDYFMALIEPLIDILSVILPPLLDILSVLAQVILPILTGVLKLVTGAINLVIDIVKDLITFIITLPQTISNIITAIIDFVLSLPEKIAYIIGWIAGELVKFVTHTIPDFVNNTISWFASLPGKIWEFVSQIPGKIWNALVNAKDKALDGAQEVFNTIVNKIKEIPGEMLNIGKNIVHGIWDGIKGAKDWLTDKIGGFANGVVKGFKKALGIKSPSVIMEKQIGVNLGLGVVEGLDDTKRQINSTVSALSSGIGTNFGMGLSDSTIGSMKSSSVRPIIYNYVNVETDPLGQTVSNIKTFSGGAKNDYNYGVGV